MLRGVPQSAASHVSAHLKPVKPRLKLANAVGSQPCASRGRPPPALPSESAEMLDVFDGTGPFVRACLARMWRAGVRALAYVRLPLRARVRFATHVRPLPHAARRHGATGTDAELVNPLEARALELHMPRTDALDFAQVLAEYPIVPSRVPSRPCPHAGERGSCAATVAEGSALRPRAFRPSGFRVPGWGLRGRAKGY